MAYQGGNPKAAAAIGKPKFNAIPPSALRELGGAMHNGWEKYGIVNWRVPGQEVSASTYVDAMLRHLHAWQEGGKCSADTTHIFPEGVHHLGHAMACCAILIDAEKHGCLIDDRPGVAVGKRPREVTNARQSKPRPSERIVGKHPALAAAYGPTIDCVPMTDAVKAAGKPGKKRLRAR